MNRRRNAPAKADKVRGIALGHGNNGRLAKQAAERHFFAADPSARRGAFAAAAAVITDKKGDMYVVGGNNHRAEEDPNGYRYDVAYNLITQTRAMKGRINLPITDPTNPNNRAFSARYNNADGSYDIFEITGGKFKPVPLVRTTDAAEAAK